MRFEFGDVEEPGILLIVGRNIPYPFEYNAIWALLPDDFRAFFQRFSNVKSVIRRPPENITSGFRSLSHLGITSVREIGGAIAILEPVAFAKIHVICLESQSFHAFDQAFGEVLVCDNPHAGRCITHALRIGYVCFDGDLMREWDARRGSVDKNILCKFKAHTLFGLCIRFDRNIGALDEYSFWMRFDKGMQAEETSPWVTNSCVLPSSYVSSTLTTFLPVKQAEVQRGYFCVLNTLRGSNS